MPLIPKKSYFLFSVAAVPLLVHLWVLQRFTVNIPFFDDFQWGYTFLNDFQRAPNFIEKWKVIFSQHNEHRIVVTRLIILFLLFVEKNLNFRHMTLIGNIFILGVYIFYIKYCFQEKFSWWWLIPVTYLWYQLQYFHNVIISYAVPNNSVVFFSLGTFYYIYLWNITHHKPHLALAVILGVIATFSNGNGILVLPILIVLCWLIGQKRLALLIGLIFLGIFIAYFNGLQLYSNRLLLSEKTLLFFLDMLSVTAFPDNITASRIMGGGILLASLGIVLRNVFVVSRGLLPAKWIFLFGTYAFLTGTAAITSLMRASYNLPPAPWYKGYSLLFILTSFLIIYTFLQEKSLDARGFLMIISLFSMANFYYSTTVFLPQINNFNATLKADLINFKRNGSWSFIPLNAGYEPYLFFNAFTRKCLQNGIYRPPLVNSLWLSKDVNPGNEQTIDTMFEGKLTDECRTFRFLPDEILGQQVFGYIQHPETHQRIFYGFYQPLAAKKSILKGGNIFQANYTFCVNTHYFQEEVPPGNYRVGIAWIDDANRLHHSMTDHYVTVKLP